MLQIVKYPYEKTLEANYYVTKFIGSDKYTTVN